MIGITQISKSTVTYVVALALIMVATCTSGQEKKNDEINDLVIDFFGYDNQPLNLRIAATEETEAYVKQKIIFDGIRKSRVPGYIATPKGKTGPFPCILLSHSGIGSKDVWWVDDSFEKGKLLVDQLLSTGYAVLMLDAQYDGERKHENDYSSSYSLVANGQVNQYRERLVQTIIEYRIAMDYLDSRDDIDMSRIGAFGTSIGANMMLVLSSVDPRLKSVVVCSTIMNNPFYEGAGSVFDPIYVKPLNPLTSYLLQVGKTDDFSPEEKVNAVYKGLNAKSKSLLFYEFGHSPSEAYLPDAVSWFKKYL